MRHCTYLLYLNYLCGFHMMEAPNGYFKKKKMVILKIRLLVHDKIDNGSINQTEQQIM